MFKGPEYSLRVMHSFTGGADVHQKSMNLRDLGWALAIEPQCAHLGTGKSEAR